MRWFLLLAALCLPVVAEAQVSQAIGRGGKIFLAPNADPGANGYVPTWNTDGTFGGWVVPPLAGGTMTGNLDMGRFNVTNAGRVQQTWFPADGTEIQTAIDAANTAGGGTVVLLPSATAYEITDQGAQIGEPLRNKCLDLKSNVALIVLRGATLQLADNEVPVGDNLDMIVIETGASNVYIGGGGRITGNAANNPNGTYSQATSCNIINSSGATTIGDISYVVIENLILDDCWANPVNLIGVERVRLSNLFTDDFGEGCQLIECSGATMSNLEARRTNPVGGAPASGDTFEMSGCINFHVSGLRARDAGHAGQCLDLFGSQNGVVSGCQFESSNGSFNLAFKLDAGGNVQPCKNVLITDVVIRNSSANAFSMPTGGGNAVISNFVVDVANGGIIPTGDVNGNAAGANSHQTRLRLFNGTVRNIDNVPCIDMAGEGRIFVQNVRFDRCDEVLRLERADHDPPTGAVLTPHEVTFRNNTFIQCDVHVNQVGTPAPGVYPLFLRNNSDSWETTGTVDTLRVFGRMSNGMVMPDTGGLGDVVIVKEHKLTQSYAPRSTTVFDKAETGDFSHVWTYVATPGSNMIFGAQSETSAGPLPSYNSLDYGIQWSTGTQIQVWVEGAPTVVPGVNVALTDTLTLERSGTTVRVLHNATPVHTFTTSDPGNTLYPAITTASPSGTWSLTVSGANLNAMSGGDEQLLDGT